MKGSKAKDIFDIAREERWFESGGFWKVQTDEEIERRWGETRSELLHKCKKRHRETVKQSRRRLGKSASRVNPMVVQI
ncbi:uncharacterized protein EI90DRAFT_3043961 [Cantharellus anzutake]|uniref:uncharacterized protein n=1 Tax=Cantharellus anzutake TaxID=1750568 RepID=UPI001903BA31|nr:uncharacterized protein EI90DRAFT_3043961 [Cantharellus anzutake]KAF8336880.1 hypothetical protein EI90DRAFT_3043961 [Cantharellus anzutake]